MFYLFATLFFALSNTKIDRFAFILFRSRLLNCWLWILRRINNHNIGQRGKKIITYVCMCSCMERNKLRRTTRTKWLKFRGVAKPAFMRSDKEKGFPSSREHGSTIASTSSWPRVTSFSNPIICRAAAQCHFYAKDEAESA